MNLKSNGQFTQRAEHAIEKAGAAAGELGHSYVGTEHLLLGIIREHGGLGAGILERRGIDEKLLINRITALNGRGVPMDNVHSLSEHARIAVNQVLISSVYRLMHTCIIVADVKILYPEFPVILF